MDDIELRHAQADRIERQRPERTKVVQRRITTPQRTFNCWDQIGRGLRAARGKQGDVVPTPHELLAERGDDTLSAAIRLRWDRLEWGCNLSDAHCPAPPGV